MIIIQNANKTYIREILLFKHWLKKREIMHLGYYIIIERAQQTKKQRRDVAHFWKFRIFHILWTHIIRYAHAKRCLCIISKKENENTKKRIRWEPYKEIYFLYNMYIIFLGFLSKNIVIAVDLVSSPLLGTYINNIIICITIYRLIHIHLCAWVFVCECVSVWLAKAFAVTFMIINLQKL